MKEQTPNQTEIEAIIKAVQGMVARYEEIQKTDCQDLETWREACTEAARCVEQLINMTPYQIEQAQAAAHKIEGLTDSIRKIQKEQGSQC